MTFNDDWEEYRPCYYRRRRPYTPEQWARLTQRPDEMIARAMARALGKTTELASPKDEQ